MGILSTLRTTRRMLEKSKADESLLGIFDFSYLHYALGDLLTEQVNLAVMAIEQEKKFVDVIVTVHPDRPSGLLQLFITPSNYLTFLDNVMPIFGSNPLIRSVEVMRDVHAVNLIRLSRHCAGAATWPRMYSHLMMKNYYPLSHKLINAFYARHGYVPQLVVPPAMRQWARTFHQAELGSRPLVVINPRQSMLTRFPGGLYRDSSLEDWYRFIDSIGTRRPDALFVMVGGFAEWEHQLALRRNVFIPRAYGLTLAHELALMTISELFMGASSGFATFATFTDIPYAILNVEQFFAGPAELTVGARRYPFAAERQIITWHPETTEELLTLFADLYPGPDSRREPRAFGGVPQGVGP
jgi:hypothetical protein